MELTTPYYYYFLFIFVLMYWVLGEKSRKYVLLGASYFLYAFWDLRYIPVLLGSTALDYFLGHRIAGAKEVKHRKILLVVSLISNLGILFFFKYFDFFQDMAYSVAALFGITVQPDRHNIFIPLGVSFYTFHSISYIVDIYRKKIEPSTSIVYYAIYVSFFPKLISGPIERFENFYPQLFTHKRWSRVDFLDALWLLLTGLVMKLCVADRLGFLTTEIFSGHLSKSAMELLLGIYGYSFQIYADFMGYTLIARGSARLFGLHLHPNFVQPYFSQNPQEFWRRWHITLSTWFRDYVYIPLGGKYGNRYVNIAITMLLAGLWHGADWKFLAWGLFHALLLVAYLLVIKIPIISSLPKSFSAILGVFLTFHFVSLGWVLFKAKTIGEASSYMHQLLSGGSVHSGTNTESLYFFILFFSLMALLSLFRKRPNNIVLTGLGYGLLMTAFYIFGATDVEPFIYYYF